ncbi:MAG: hypothetical protein ACI89U_003069, partial [Gammaproteobacteria bacterium]
RVKNAWSLSVISYEVIDSRDSDLCIYTYLFRHFYAMVSVSVVFLKMNYV